jgi:hypothetical protein
MAKKLVQDYDLHNVTWELDNQHLVEYTEKQAKTILRKCRKEVRAAADTAFSNTIYEEVERMNLQRWPETTE